MKPHLGREVAASEYAHRLQELNKAVDKVQDFVFTNWRSYK
jgi:hypothetical protein